MAANTVPRRLHRSATDRVVTGVCGGLAEYLEVDPSLVRLAFIVGFLWGGASLLVYIVMALVLPVETQPQAPTFNRQERSRYLAGGVLILLGALLLIGNLGWAPWLSWNLFWPAVLIVIGGALLLRSSGEPAASE